LRRISNCGCWEDEEVERLCKVASIGWIKLESRDPDLNYEELGGTLSKLLVSLLKRRVYGSSVSFRVEPYGKWQLQGESPSFSLSLLNQMNPTSTKNANRGILDPQVRTRELGIDGDELALVDRLLDVRQLRVEVVSQDFHKSCGDGERKEFFFKNAKRYVM
jgi:hypothetical protein